MSPAKILSDLTAAGIRLEVRDGTLTAGPREALTDELRALIREHKAGLLVELDQSIPRRSWLIRHADGAVASHTFEPPATLAQVRAWYPEARAIEPEPETAGDPSNGGLTQADETTIVEWLRFIGEPDSEIPETIGRCRADPETRAYFLRRAAEDAPRMFYRAVLGTEPSAVASLEPQQVAMAVAVGLLPHDPGPAMVVLAKRWRGKQALALIPAAKYDGLATLRRFAEIVETADPTTQPESQPC